VKTYLTFFIFSFFISLILILGCENEYPDSLWSTNYETKPRPIINNVSPPLVTYSGIGVLQINGEDFSSVLDENHVYFNGTKVNILSATETQLNVQVPALLDMQTAYLDSIVVKVRVDGSILYAEYQNHSEYYIGVKNTAIEFGGFEESDNLGAIACDNNETLILTSKKKVYKVTKDSTKKEFAELRVTGATSMKLGPGGYLYYVKGKGIFRLLPEGGHDASWLLGFKRNIYDLDFDKDGNMFCAGQLGEIYRVNIDSITFETMATYDDTEINSLRIFNDAVYVVTEYDGNNESIPINAIYKNAINQNGSLGPNELVVNWDDYEQNSDSEISDITFASSGELFIGAGGDATNALHIRYPSGDIEPFYSPLLFAPTFKLCWGPSHYLYLIGTTNNDEKRVIKIEMFDKDFNHFSSAPYYGRQ